MDGNNQLIQFEINDDTSLLKACDMLHDANFNLSVMKFNNTDKKWVGTFKREYFENLDLIHSQSKFLFFTKYTFPLVETVLKLENIATIQVNDKAEIELFTFNKCQLIKGKYIFFFNEAMEIEIEFEERPKGSFQDKKFLDGKGTMFAFRDFLKRKKDTAKEALDETKKIAQKMIDGEMNIYKGSEEIAKICVSHDFPDELGEIYHLAHLKDGHEDIGFNRDSLKEKIIMEARKLLM